MVKQNEQTIQSVSLNDLSRIARSWNESKRFANKAYPNSDQFQSTLSTLATNLSAQGLDPVTEYPLDSLSSLTGMEKTKLNLIILTVQSWIDSISLNQYDAIESRAKVESVMKEYTKWRQWIENNIEQYKANVEASMRQIGGSSSNLKEAIDAMFSGREGTNFSNITSHESLRRYEQLVYQVLNGNKGDTVGFNKAQYAAYRVIISILNSAEGLVEDKFKIDIDSFLKVEQRRVTVKQQIKQFKNQLESKKADHRQYHRLIADTQPAIKKLSQQMETLVEQLKQAQASGQNQGTLVGLETQIQMKNDDINKLLTTVKDMETKAKDTEAEIAKITAQINKILKG